MVGDRKKGKENLKDGECSGLVDVPAHLRLQFYFIFLNQEKEKDKKKNGTATRIPAEIGFFNIDPALCCSLQQKMRTI